MRRFTLITLVLLFALLTVVGGGLIIWQSRADAAAADTVAIMAGVVGAALKFVFQREVQAATARQAAQQTANGAAHAAGNGHHPATD